MEDSVHPSHEIYTPEDFTEEEYASDSILACLVAKGANICKRCGEWTEDLALPCGRSRSVLCGEERVVVLRTVKYKFNGGAVEVGKVVKENKVTAHVFFPHITKQPILNLKKSRLELMYGDNWDKQKGGEK